MKPKKVPVKEEKSGETRRLKDRIRRLEEEKSELEKKVKKLLSEIRSLESYKEVTKEYIDNNLDGVPVEEVIKRVNKKKRLRKKEKKVVEVCPKCFSENYAVVPTPFGKVKACGNCKHRETIKNVK